jgi:hypothetical protein
MDEQLWRKIVSEALERGIKESKGAVAGAKLRQLVSQAAVQNGTKYPLEGFEEERFSDFLKRFNSILLVLKRKSQDLLVAPAAQPELLSDLSSSDKHAVIRADLFTAFTRIGRGNPPKEPWYDRTRDTIVWLEPDAPIDEASLVRIPAATQEQEVSDRKAFVQSEGIEPGTRDSLLHALEESGQSSVLWGFSQVIRSSRLSRKWHVFRFQELTKRIRAWCEQDAIVWRDDWIVAVDERSQEASGEVPIVVIERTALEELFSRLTEDDLRRISIPLDIVLKLMPK